MSLLTLSTYEKLELSYYLNIRFYRNRLKYLLQSFAPVLIFLVGLLPLKAQDSPLLKQNVQWLHYYNKMKLGDSWQLLTDGGYRWKAGFQQPTQFIVRTGLGYSISNKIRLAAGFAHLGFYGSNKLTKQEYRPYQEVLLRNKFNKLIMLHRYRVEERFFNNLLDNNLSNINRFIVRIRYRFMLSIPIVQLSKTNPGKRFSFKIGQELLLNTSVEAHRFFDQLRLQLSPVIQWNNNWSSSIMWSNHISSTNTPGQYQYTCVLWLQIRQQLDFVKN